MGKYLLIWSPEALQCLRLVFHPIIVQVVYYAIKFVPIHNVKPHLLLYIPFICKY